MHPEQREEHQHEHLAAEHAAGDQIAARVEQDQRDRDETRDAQEIGEHVVDDEVVVRPHRVQPQRRQRHTDGDEQRELRQPVRDMASVVGHEQVDQQDRGCRGQDDDLGQCGAVR